MSGFYFYQNRASANLIEAQNIGHIKMQSDQPHKNAHHSNQPQKAFSLAEQIPP
jgi:hypothetical protein